MTKNQWAFIPKDYFRGWSFPVADAIEAQIKKDVRLAVHTILSRQKAMITRHNDSKDWIVLFCDGEGIEAPLGSLNKNLSLVKGNDDEPEHMRSLINVLERHAARLRRELEQITK